MKKFTQGEWEIVCSDDETFMRSVCQVSGDCFINSSQKLSEDLLADAHLIAAAPDMYRMLEALLDAEGVINDYDNRSAIKRMLAKARGESCD